MELATINYFLGAVVVLLLIRRFFFSEPDVPVPQEPEPMVYTVFTPSSLEKFNGESDPRVLLAVKGKVFDVTNGKSFYGPGGPYANFAGHDASRGLAKNSFDPSMITPVSEPIDSLSDLDDEERKSLDEWFNHFEAKYPICGELVNESAKSK